MARETRAYSLHQLLSALAQKGFSDSSGAVVSQLHRLKKLGLVNQPASGMYEITTDGLGHQRKLRSSFGAFAGDAR
jgi:DNA-binding PadR family transcriptional regulator